LAFKLEVNGYDPNTTGAFVTKECTADKRRNNILHHIIPLKFNDLVNLQSNVGMLEMGGRSDI
jgi:hypothetical protein